MARSTMSSLVLKLLLFNLCCSLLVSCSYSQDDEKKIYIVYMGGKPKNSETAHLHHRAMLEEVVGSSFLAQDLIYSYKRSFNGFAVKLTKKQSKEIAARKDVVSVFLNQYKHLHTPRSWDFMNFPVGVPRVPQVESNSIVGVLDTGIWPESPSFCDKSCGPLPPKWKGACDVAGGFQCNRKIIGARVYRCNNTLPAGDIWSPRDTKGHGTHVASIAAGGLVNNANFFGLGQGTARGGVPSARIAVYKVCWFDVCYDADILAAFDDAIADGVDVISASFGSLRPQRYFYDSISIGAFHAMQYGVLTTNSAGNDGPRPFSVPNVSPWSLTVSASTIDRRFATQVQIGNGKTFQGVVVNTFELWGIQYPLIYAGNVPAAGFDPSISKTCQANSVDLNSVWGRILLCDGFQTPSALASFYGVVVGVIMNNGPNDKARTPYPFPAAYLDTAVGDEIKQYINSTSNPTIAIFKSSAIYDRTAPVVASFSSVGPNFITRDIIKPDLTAPGVEILAAWSPSASVSGVIGDPRRTQYNIISGTSASCAHVTAIAVYVKTFYPKWSPAAIKSALMTTALPMNAQLSPKAELAYGSGHVYPLKALNPGLVYDVSESDYANFLCGQSGYTPESVRLITGDKNACTTPDTGRVWDLNYPSFGLSTGSSRPFNQVFKRTLTNVGNSVCTYRVAIVAPQGVTITVSPSSLSFSYIGQKKSFTLTVQGTVTDRVSSGSLVWSNGEYDVRSPISVYIID